MAYFKCNGYGRIIDSSPNNYNTYKSASNLSESQFIDWISNGGAKYAIDKKETSSWLKKNITISNSQTKYKTFQIADFGHDNSGYTVDLICANNVISRVFSSNTQIYYSSDIRTWLNGTYYNAFSSTLRSYMTTMTVVTNGSSTVNDKVKLLSCTELGVTAFNSYMPSGGGEGTAYPIFTKGSCSSNISDRWRSGANKYIYWTRTRDISNTDGVCGVNSYGNMSSTYYYGNDIGVVPVLRFKVQ